MLQMAEKGNDRAKFAHILRHHIDELQRYLVRHPLAVERAFPRFNEYLNYRKTHSPFFAHRWDCLFWRQRLRWKNKPSLLQKIYPVLPMSSNMVSAPRSAPSDYRSRQARAHAAPSIPLSTNSRRNFVIPVAGISTTSQVSSNGGGEVASPEKQ